VRSDSQSVAEVYRQQLWFKPTAPGEPSKSWAEMIRDYAPFQSGSRHQLTLFFNLATLYEHTWDPAVGQVLDEYAAAFLDPQHEIGVWRCQDNDLPGKSDSPMLAHYWAPALWKYARASGDPRMPDILRRYFMAGYHADPFAEDVGVYSNVQIGWAWYFTRDPRHLPPALHELKRLLPNALPLSKPEDLGPRIYNPHKPPQVFTAVPRLIAALDDARRQGLEPTAEPLTPQRTLMAIHKLPGQKLSMTLWGWEPQPQLLDAGGKAVGALSEHQSHKSHRMPFDRVPRDYLARQCRATIESAASKDAWFFLDPKVDVGVVETRGVDHLLCWGAKPVQLEPARQFWWQPPRDAQQLVLESAQPTQLKIVRDGVELTGKVVINRLTVLLAGSSAPLAIESRIENAPLWFRLVDVPDDACWLSARGPVDTTPPQFPTPHGRKQPAVAELPAPTFVPGRFGQGLLIVPGRELQIPDERTDAAGQARRLSDERQGTIEFWIHRQWDNRTRNIYNVELLTNGPLQVLAPARLPLDEWSHVAAVWRPSPSDPSRRLVHIYVDGRDYAWYRSIDWEGYAKPPTIFAARAWLKNFLLHAPANTSYVIDDLRISNTARYAALDVELGQRQSYNPYQFEPPAKAEKPDPQTTLLYFSFDGDLRGTALGDTPLEATLRMEKR
jgi:hypothetical protein